MRWFVEVATLSAGGPATRVTVEAPSWQAALAQARTARSDTTPLSNYTIEVLAEGYRATNPATRTRYTVNKAPDDAPLGSAEPPPASVPEPKPPSTPASIVAATLRRPARPAAPAASNAPGATVPSAAAPAPSGNGAPAAPANKPDVDAAPNTVAQAKRPEAAPPRPSSGGAAPPRPASVPPAGGTLPSTAVAPMPAAPAAPRIEPAAAAPSPATALEGKVFLRRGEDPGGRSPLTYREVGIAVTPGTSLDRAVSIAHAHLEDVQRTLDTSRAPPGRLVQLAIFDHEWKSRPERRPLVTLTYKDWKGKPTLSYPGKSTPPPEQYAAPPVVAAALTPAVGAGSRPRMDAASVAAEIAGAVASSEAARTSAAQPAAAAEIPKSVEAIVAPPPPVIIDHAPTAPSAPALGGRPASGRFDARATGPTSDRPRARPEDLMSEIFESMHDLHFLRDSLEGAEFVLELLHQKVPTKIALIHLYDINTKEFVVVKARAPGTAVVGTRSREGTGLVGASAKSGHGILVDDASKDERWSRERYQAAGHAPKSLCVVPVRQGQRYLGAIELADHSDGKPFGEDVLHAVTYIAEQFAEFVADRGVTLKAGESGAFNALDPKH
jgi:putative methionine-R-sulfoxide reductase with GAF domain